MRAGLLREHVTFQKRERVQTASGAYSDSLKILLRTKCHKLKERPLLGKEINAREEFFDRELRIQCRDNPLIHEATDVVFQNRMYRILLVDSLIRDKTVVIHLKLNNE